MRSPATAHSRVAALALMVMVTLTACGGATDRPTNHPVVSSSAETPVPSTSGAGSLPTPNCSSDGTVEHVAFEDSTQGAQGDYQVYLPPCYAEKPSLRYPVVYLLHGAGQSDTHFLEVGIVQAADHAIRQGNVAPMILVTTDGGPNYSSGRGGVTFDKYLVDELVPRIDASYRTVAERHGRAIGGISMGGGRALNIAAEAPPVFEAVGGHSPVVNDPAGLASALSRGDVRVWLDVGQDDYLRGGIQELAAGLQGSDAAVELEVPTGGHDRGYWRAHLGQYLGFYDRSFRAAG